MKNINKKTAIVFGLSCALSVLFIVTVYKTMGIYYAINDDMTMKNIVSGVFDGKPDSHIVYIQYIIGLLLSTLHTIKAGIDWYGVFMLGTVAISLACMVYKSYMITSEKKQYGVFLCGLILFFIVSLKEVFNFQWTVVAAFPGAAAMFMLTHKKEKYRFDWETGMIVVLSLISFSIRKNVFMMILPVMGLVVFGMYVMPLFKNGLKNVEKEKFKYILLPVASILALMVIIDGIDTYAYESDPDWAEYRRFNSARSDIMDYGGFPDYDAFWDIYEDIGYTEEDADALLQFGIITDLDADKLEKIAEYNKKLHGKDSVEDAFDDALDCMEEVLEKDAMIVLHTLVAVFILILLLQIFWTRKNVIIKLLFILYEVALAFYLAIGGRFPTRIAKVFDIYIVLACFAIFLCGLKAREKQSVLQWCIVVPVLVILFNMSGYQVTDALDSKKNYESMVSTIERVNNYVESQEGQVIITAPNTFPTKERFTFYREAKIIRKVGTAGWSQKAPFFERKKELLGLKENDLYLLNENVQFISNQDFYVRIICEYYSQYTEYPVTYEEIDKVCGAEVYRFYEQVE